VYVDQKGKERLRNLFDELGLNRKSVGVGGLGNMDLWGIIVGIKGQGK
jgi:hypothetical protein